MMGLAGFNTWLWWASVWLGGMAILSAALLRAARVRRATLHRAVWGIVLASGLVSGLWRADIPWRGVSSAAPLPFSLRADRDSVVGRLAEGGEESAGETRGATGNAVGTARDGVDFSAPRVSHDLWHAGAFSLWLAGLMLVVSLQIARYARWRRRVDRFPEAPGEWRTMWTDTARRMGWSGRVAMRCSESDGPLLTWHRGRYLLVVPSLYWASRTAAERRSILQHEAAHLVQRDIVLAAVLRALACLHWFNPFSWFALRRFEEATEWSCDDRVRQADPRSLLILARSLLELSTPAAPQIGVRAMTGSCLGRRLRRMVDADTFCKESKMKHVMLLLVALALFVVGAVRFELVPVHSEEPERAPARAVDWKQRARELAGRLADDELAGRLRAVLETDAGTVALQETLAGEMEAARREFRRQVVPQLIEKKLGGTSDEARAFQRRFVAAAQRAEQDLAAIHAEFRRLADRFSEATPLDRLARRFLQHDGAHVVLYFEALLPRLRLSDEMILERLGEVFAVDNDYHYFIRGGRKTEADRIADRGLALARQTRLIQQETAEYAKEFATESKLDQRFKAALADPLLPAFVTALLFEAERHAADEAVDEFFENLNWLAVDTDQGLSVVGEERQAEVKEILQRFDRAKQVVARVAKPLGQFADKIRDHGEAERKWKAFLKTPTAQVLLSLELELPPADPGAGARAILMSFFTEDDDGKLRVDVGDRDPAEMQEQLSDFFRSYRSLRRAGRKIEQRIASFPDGPVKSALGTIAGKALIIQEARKLMRTTAHDVWTKWIEAHFTASDKGLVVADTSRDVIEALIERAAEIEKELQNDDF